jgi:hypothetical protein
MALLVGVVPGCLLYTDPVNAPPVVTIVTSPAAIYPNQSVTLEADGSDPDGDHVSFTWWTVPGLCSEATPADWSAAMPASADRVFSLQVLGHEAACVRVIGRDSHGAAAEPRYIELAPRNRPPRVTLTVPGATGAVPLFSTVRLEAGPLVDEDGDELTFKWKAVDPAGAPVTFARCDGPVEEHARCLAAERTGAYMVTVEASDGVPASAPATSTVSVAVGPDQPPCIEATDPSAETGVVVLAVTDPPRRFEVRQVKDDGHPFPAGPLGKASFQWFTAREGSAIWTRALGYTEATFDVGASRFDDARPGSVFRVRVEARDPQRENPAAWRELEAACEDRAICRLPESCVRWMTWSVRFR